VSADARGYYSALGLGAGAPIDAVRSAFRRLAKECHPDRPSCVDGGQRFRRIAEAYEALSNAEFKAAYDKGTAANDASQPSQPPPKVEPIKCEVCGGVTAQPRRLAFWRVTSLILASHKAPVQKIFCHKCASKEQWKSTVWTSLLGWWGIPWGPIWSVANGITNATGGTRQSAVDEALMWQNAVAFSARGDGSLAIGLSNILRKSDNSKVAQHAAEIIQFFAARGFDPTTTLKDVWKRSPVRIAALLATAFAVPALAVGLIYLPGDGAHTGTSASTPAVGAFTPAHSQVGQAAATNLPQTTTHPREPTCASPPLNGDLLIDHRAAAKEGHELDIENGTSGDAIVKIRNAIGGRVLASFFVARGQTASLADIPDGMYTIQYATGDQLQKNCHSFVNDGSTSANQFPEPETFQTRYEEVPDGTQVIYSRLTYTLYPVPQGNVHPNNIDLNAFDQP